MQPSAIKQKAITLRRKGYSYNIIATKLNLSKSTLSDWLSEIPFKPNKVVLKRIKLAQMKSAIYKNNQKIANILSAKKIAKKEAGNLTKRDLWLLGIGLYLGEGTKTNENIRIINSDPEIIKVAIVWFQKICGLENKNIVPIIHLYPDNNIKKAINYWSKITGIPGRQFAKTQIDRRLNKSSKRKGRLPYGTLQLQIKSYGRREFGRFLHRRIMGWTESLIDQINQIK